jgi:uncharacterized coiled-coil protein SlyX
MAMRELVSRLGSLVSGSASAVGALRKRLTEPPHQGSDARLDALEHAMEIQATLNETVDVQIKLIHTLLDKAQKRLRTISIVLIVTATVATLAFAAALMR